MRALVLSSAWDDPAFRRKLRELTGLGWSIVAATPGGAAGEEGGVRLAPVPASGSAPEPLDRRWSGRVLRRLLTDTRPDLVWIEGEPDTRAAHTATREAARLKIPSAVLGWESLPRQRGWLAARRYGASLRRVSGVAGVNRHALNLLSAGAPNVPTAVLPQLGITPPGLAPDRRPSDQFRLAYVGRLIPERGADRLLRACGQLMGQWILTVVGTGPEQEALEQLAQRLGLASRIRWLGPRTRAEVAALWAETDCLIVPSRATAEWIEVWSEAVLDAMAHEVAVVATATGALPELLDGVGIVAADDEELHLRMQELVKDRDRRTILGREGRRRILDWYVDSAVARETDAFWRQVVRAPLPQ